MASNTTSFIGKVNNNQVDAVLLSQNDINKLKTTISQVSTNKAAIEQIKKDMVVVNQFQRVIAEFDFFKDDTNNEKMKTNVIYLVGMHDGQFVAPNKSGDKFWPDGKIPQYFELVRKDEAGQRQKLGRWEYSANLDNYLTKTGDNEFSGMMTRLVKEAEQDDGDATPYVTKFADLEIGKNPTKDIYAGHIALDKNGKKLYAHTGLYKKNGERQASLGVYKNDGTAVGEVCLKTNAAGDKVQLIIPDVSSDAGNNEAATVKYVKDQFNGIDKSNIAYKNKANTFTEDQTFNKNVLIAPADANNVNIKSKVADSAIATGISGNKTAGLSLTDPNGDKAFATLSLNLNQNARQAAISVNGTDGAIKGALTVSCDANNKVKASAPHPTADGGDDQIVTVKALNEKVANKVDFKYQDSKPASVDDIPNNTIICYPSQDLL